MKHYLVAVFDSRTGAFMAPAAVASLAVAQRSFWKETEGDGAFVSMKGDVSLHLVGTFDEESGNVEPANQVLVAAPGA